MPADSYNARENWEILPVHSSVRMKRHKGESCLRINAEVVHILQQIFTDAPTKPQVRIIMWNQTQKTSFSLLSLCYNTRSPLLQSVRLYHYSFSLDTKGIVHILHTRRVLLWRVKGIRNYRQDLWADLCAGNHVRTGFYSLAQHLLLKIS